MKIISSLFLTHLIAFALVQAVPVILKDLYYATKENDLDRIYSLLFNKQQIELLEHITQRSLNEKDVDYLLRNQVNLEAPIMQLYKPTHINITESYLNLKSFVWNLDRALLVRPTNSKLFIDFRQGGKTMLMEAAAESNAAVVELLLAHKASTLLRDENGNSPLLLALSSSRPVNEIKRVVKALLSYQADVSARNLKGECAITLAQVLGDEELIEMINCSSLDSCLFE